MRSHEAQAAALKVARIMLALSGLYFLAWSVGNGWYGLPSGTPSILDHPPAHADLERKFPGLHDTGGIRFEKIQDRAPFFPFQRINNSFEDLGELEP